MNTSNNYRSIFNSPSNTVHIPTSVTNSNQTLPLKTLPLEFYANMGSIVIKKLQRILEYSITSVPIGVIQSFDNLISQLQLDRRYSSVKSGSFNDVYRFQSQGLAIRVSKTPTPINTHLKSTTTNSLTRTTTCVIYVSPNGNNIKELELIKKTKDNWEMASLESICPKIFFNGYIIKSDRLLYSVTITECYECDLGSYFTDNLKGWDLIKERGTLVEDDFVIGFTGFTFGRTRNYDKAKKRSIIAKKLMECFNTLARRMNVICFDIKPLNAVINDRGDNEDQIDVRLIDLDVDSCHDYSNILQRYSGDTDQTDKIIDIMNLYMANLFYDHTGCNIFYEIFTHRDFGGYLRTKDIIDKNGDINELKRTRDGQTKYAGPIESLIELWCNLSGSNSKMNRFDELAKHYFSDYMGCGAERVNDTMTCRETFEFVLRNSIKHYNEPVMNYLVRVRRQFHSTPGGSKTKTKSKLLRRIKKKTNKNRNKIKRKCKRSRRKN